MPSKRILAAALAAGLALCAPSAWAQASETPLPAGLKGRLVVQVESQGKAGVPARAVTLDLFMVSEATSPSHLLLDGMDEDMQRDMQQYQKAGKMIEQANPMDPERMRKAFALLDTCNANENSASCQQGRQAMQDVERDMAALQERGAQEQAAAPAYTSQNRYQSWGGSLQDGCGTLSARMGERSLRLPANASKQGNAVACATRFVIDRRAGEVSMMVTPLRLAFPVQGNARGFDFTFDDLGRDSGAKFNHQTGALTLRKLAAGKGKALSGTKSFRSARGVVTTVRWSFTQH